MSNKNGEQTLSIWFFVGLMLVLYGIIMIIASIQFMNDPEAESHVILSELHSDIWWSILLFILGVVFLVIHNPKKKKIHTEE